MEKLNESEPLESIENNPCKGTPILKTACLYSHAGWRAEVTRLLSASVSVQRRQDFHSGLSKEQENLPIGVKRECYKLKAESINTME